MNESEVIVPVLPEKVRVLYPKPTRVDGTSSIPLPRDITSREIRSPSANDNSNDLTSA